MNRLLQSLLIGLISLLAALPAGALTVPTVDRFRALGDDEQVRLVENLRSEAQRTTGDYDTDAAIALLNYLADSCYDIDNYAVLYPAALCFDEGLIVERDYQKIMNITGAYLIKVSVYEEDSENDVPEYLNAFTIYADAGLHVDSETDADRAFYIHNLNSAYTTGNDDALRRLREYKTAMPDVVNPVPELLERYDSVKIATFYGLEHYDKGIYTVKKDGLYGMTDYYGNEILPTKYARITYNPIDTIDQPFYIVDPDTRLTAIFNREGKQLTPFGYKDLYLRTQSELFSPDCYCVFATDNNGRAGALDIFGHTVAPCRYDSIAKFYADSEKDIYLVEVRDKGRAGVINKDGKWIVPLEAKSLDISDEYKVISYIKNGKEGVVSFDGTEGFPPEAYSTVFYLTERVFGGKTPKGWVLVDINGKRLNNEVYKTVYTTGDRNVIFVENNKKRWAALDTLGNRYTDFVFSGAKYSEDKNGDLFIDYDFTIGDKTFNLTGTFNRGLAPVAWYNGDDLQGFGYVNTDGQIAIEPVYLTAEEFDDNGEAIVSLNVDEDANSTTERHIIINTKGEQLRYHGVYGIEKIDGKYGWYSFEGEEILPPVYRDMEMVYGNGYVILNKVQDDATGKWGIFHYFYQTQLLPLSYDDIRLCQLPYGDYNDFFFIVKQNGLSAVTASDGQMLIPFTDRHIARVDFIDSEPVAVISDEDETVFGLMGYDGELILPIEYKEFIFADSTIFANKDGRWGLVNARNDVLIPFEYDSYDNVSPQLFCLKKGDKPYLYNPQTGENILSAGDNCTRVKRTWSRQAADRFVYAVENKKGKWALLSEDGKQRTKYVFGTDVVITYDDEDDSKEEDIRILVDGKKYVPYSTYDNKRITLRRTEPEDSTLIDHIAVVNDNGKIIYEGDWFYYNDSNRDSVYVTDDRGAEFMVLDSKGRVIKRLGYHAIAYPATYRLAVRNREGLAGLIDSETFRLVVPCIYGTIGDSQFEFEDGETVELIPVAIERNATRPDFFIDRDGNKLRDVTDDDEINEFPIPEFQ